MLMFFQRRCWMYIPKVSFIPLTRPSLSTDFFPLEAPGMQSPRRYPLQLVSDDGFSLDCRWLGLFLGFGITLVLTDYIDI
jgi:hypothetical protein